MDLDFFLKIFKSEKPIYVDFTVALIGFIKKKMESQYIAAPGESTLVRRKHGLSFILGGAIYF